MGKVAACSGKVLASQHGEVMKADIEYMFSVPCYFDPTLLTMVLRQSKRPYAVLITCEHPLASYLLSLSVTDGLKEHGALSVAVIGIQIT